MPVDPNVFNNIKNFQDYNIQNQQFLAQQLAANQALQTGAIDQATKTNAYVTQVLSGAAAGGQDSYLQTKKALLQKFPDAAPVVNAFSDNAAEAVPQLQTARLAQSPLGGLINTATKLDSNTNNAAIAGGNVPADPNAIVNNLLKGGTLTGRIPVTTQPPTIQQATTQSPSSIITPTSPIPAVNGSKFTAALATPPAAAAPQPIPIPADVQAPIAGPSANRVYQTVAPGSGNATSFVTPANDPTKTQAANQAAYTQALEAYKASPAGIMETAKAGKLGADQADAVKNDAQAQTGYDQVQQTMGAIKDIINSGKLPTGTGALGVPVPAALKATLNQNSGTMGDPTITQAYDNFEKLNEAQTIGAIRTLADTGQIKMTRTLENIINKGYLINPNSTDASKISQANIIQTELRNSAVAAHNVNETLNGGDQAAYTSPLIAPPSNVTGSVAPPVQINPVDAMNEIERRKKAAGN